MSAADAAVSASYIARRTALSVVLRGGKRAASTLAWAIKTDESALAASRSEREADVAFDEALAADAAEDFGARDRWLDREEAHRVASWTAASAAVVQCESALRALL